MGGGAAATRFFDGSSTIGLGGTEPLNIYLRNYEPSKSRCERASRTNKSNLLSQSLYENVKADGNYLRTKNILKERHKPLKLAEVGETGRINEAIKEQGCLSLRDSFNMKMYSNPVWKSVDKAKWKNPRGMSYQG